MSAWIDQLRQALHDRGRAVLVTVAEIRGSAPREPGARMVIGESTLRGTIGGGNLEHRATEIAREMLTQEAREATLRRFPLGPSLGQCCGGVAVLAFEPVTEAGCAWLEALQGARAARRALALVTRPDAPCEQAKLLLAPDGSVAGSLGDPMLDTLGAKAAHELLAAGLPTVRLQQIAGTRLLLEAVLPVEPEIVLFGAGHVGRALVQVLGTLPCRVAWVDPRPDQFPSVVPANVNALVHAVPAQVVTLGLPGTSWVVMTHSHALDLEICASVLGRGDARYCGLIGSLTKRRRFVRRLRGLGLGDDALGRLTCPIGVSAIRSKHPGAIAVAVAAEMLQVAALAPAREALAAGGAPAGRARRHRAQDDRWA
jgi:xanthine dehydrogenase accessory factor